MPSLVSVLKAEDFRGLTQLTIILSQINTYSFLHTMALWTIWQGNFLSPIHCFLWLGWKKKGRLTSFLCWVRLTTHSAPTLNKRNLKRDSHVLLGFFGGTRVEKWMSELTWGDLTFTLLWTYALNQPTWHSTKLCQALIGHATQSGHLVLKWPFVSDTEFGPPFKSPLGKPIKLQSYFLSSELRCTGKWNLLPDSVIVHPKMKIIIDSSSCSKPALNFLSSLKQKMIFGPYIDIHYTDKKRHRDISQNMLFCVT